MRRDDVEDVGAFDGDVDEVLVVVVDEVGQLVQHGGRVSQECLHVGRVRDELLAQLVQAVERRDEIG